MAELTMVEALNLALKEAMREDERVLVLGEDVGLEGGIFRVTEDLQEEFGARRALDTPLAEAVIVGASLGMAIRGLRPVCELQFSGFSYFAMHQLESHAARMRWRSGGGFTAPLVVRMPYGAGVRALEHHSESKEVFFAHTPGLKVVVPSTPRNARALLRAAIEDPDPVVFLEPKLIYRSFREEVPEEPETLPLGEPHTARSGGDITLISYGAMTQRTLAAAETLSSEHDIEAEVIDLRTLSPLEPDAIVASVKRTGRAVVVTEAHRSFGPAAEIGAQVAENAFYRLEAPVRRVTGYDVHVPLFAREQAYLPDESRIVTEARRVVATRA
jgi:pyruvate dehydrogenase E1 component beta subunit